MTRQYIGARYVPKFSDINGGVWSSSYTYEALEIVKHGNDYYTAKKPVPTGIDLSNTDYWVLTGNYNGAIADLTERVVNMEKQVNLADRKFWFIGDSFLAGYGVTFPTWGTLLNSLLGKTDTYVTGWGGAGFCAPGNNSKTLVQNVHDLSDVPSGITDVVVIAGYNDMGDTYLDTFEEAVANFLSEVRSKCNNSKVNIIMGFNGLAFNTSLGGFNSRSKYLGYYYQMFKRVLMYQKVALVEGIGYQLQCRGMIYSDLVHPSETCQKYLSRILANYIVNGLDQWMPLNYLMGGFYFNVADKNIKIGIFSQHNVYDGGAISIPAFTNTNIGQFNALPFIGRYEGQITVIAMVRIVNSGGTTYMMAQFTIDKNGNILVCIPESLTGVTRILVYGASECVIDPFANLYSYS